MTDVQRNFSNFANNFGLLFTSNFSPGPIVKGEPVVIVPGLRTGGDTSAPVKPLVVTVTSQTPRSWTFTTDPAHHFFKAAITFMASNDANGNLTFAITANANYSSWLSHRLGPIIKAGENSTWNNLLNNVQTHCASGSVE